MLQKHTGPNSRRRASGRIIARFVTMLFGLMLFLPAPVLRAQTSLQPFLGRWDLSLKTPAKELPSWIEVSDVEGKLQIVMVGVTDHATRLARVQLHGGEIEFVSPKGEEGFAQDMTFKGKVVGGQLVGTVAAAGGVSFPWVGRKAPALKRTGTPVWGKPITLFNGKDFTGWRFSDPKRSANWKVEDGELVNYGHGSEIITTSKFQDFMLHVEFNCGPQSNSGVFLRGRYEVQIETDSALEPPSHHTGGVYGFLRPRRNCPASPANGVPSI